MHEKSPIKIWRMQKYRYRLTGSFCKKCGTKYFPFRFFCSSCHDEKYIKEFELIPYGKVISWTQIHIAPSGFEKFTPYIIALVKLDDGPILLSQICDCEIPNLRKGLKVEAVFRKLGMPDDDAVIKYSLKFRPAQW